MDSVASAGSSRSAGRAGRDLCFVIGGPFGLDLEHVDHRFSLGELTLPHQLARVVLLEQLYRGAQDPGRRAVPLLMADDAEPTDPAGAAAPAAGAARAASCAFMRRLAILLAVWSC